MLAFEGATVYAPTDILDWIRSQVAGSDVASVMEPKTWHDLLGGAVHSAWGPVKHFYLDRQDRLGDLAAGRRLNPRDAEAIGAMRAAVDSQDWTVAGFTAQTAMLFGIFEEDRLMAAANLTPGPDAATDVGFLVRPDARGRGYGLKIAALAARQAIMMHGIARYRAFPSSPSMVAIADRLGFEEYGGNVVAYLNDSPVLMP